MNDGKRLFMDGLKGIVVNNGLADVLPDSANNWIFSKSTPVFAMDDRSVENAANIGFKAMTLADAAATLLPRAPGAIRSVASWFDTTSDVAQEAVDIPTILGGALDTGSALPRVGLDRGLDAGTLIDAMGQIAIDTPKIDIAAPEISINAPEASELAEGAADALELPEISVGAERSIPPTELDLSPEPVSVDDIAGSETVQPGVAQIPWGACFLPGTPVHTKNGTKPIEEIESGDWVAARNQYSKETTWRQVLQTFASKDKDVVHVRVDHSDGSHETISATTEHPFYVTEKGWTGANALQPGDLLELVEGGRSRVANVLADGNKYIVHNFEEHDHTYFVGGRGVWVHNTLSVFDTLRESGVEVGDASNEVPPRTFDVKDPGVGPIIDAIEARAPGTVRQAEIRIYRPNGTAYTDFDIVTDTHVIQVKVGTGKGIVKQIQASQELTDYPVIGFDANEITGAGGAFKSSVVKNVESNGLTIVNNIDDLMKILSDARKSE